MGFGEKWSYSPVQARETKEKDSGASSHFKSKGKKIRDGLRSINAHAEQKGLELT